MAYATKPLRLRRRLLQKKLAASLLTTNQISRFKILILSITNVPQAGFNLHILASYNPLPNVNVRFLPGLSFQDRSLQYQFLKANNKIDTQTKPISSVWLEFPVLEFGLMDIY